MPFASVPPPCLPVQLVNACQKNPHYGMSPLTGRGAPEIDLFEGMSGPVDPLPNTKVTKPYFSTSLQISPGVKSPRPVLTHKPLKGMWYEGMEYGPNSTLNNFFYGVELLHKVRGGGGGEGRTNKR